MASEAKGPGAKVEDKKSFSPREALVSSIASLNAVESSGTPLREPISKARQSINQALEGVWDHVENAKDHAEVHSNMIQTKGRLFLKEMARVNRYRNVYPEMFIGGCALAVMIPSLLARRPVRGLCQGGLAAGGAWALTFGPLARLAPPPPGPPSPHK